jgi:hypothetical protein
MAENPEVVLEAYDVSDPVVIAEWIEVTVLHEAGERIILEKIDGLLASIAYPSGRLPPPKACCWTR